MVALGARMYARGYISGVAGNLSARLPDGNILATPAGLDKSEMKPEQMVVVDAQGRLLSALSGLQPTSELPMHLEVYRQRPDVGAVVHAHPMHCVALSLVGGTLEDPYIPEAIVLLGPVPTTAYATPSSEENRDAIAGLIATHDAIVLAHHGSLTVGRDLDEAYLRLETMEHTAETLFLAHLLGEPQKLSSQALSRLHRKT
jgi:L-fuculose-phosphate aldolase